MEWLWFSEPVEVSGLWASLLKAEVSEFRITLKQKENQKINTCRRRPQAGWSPALLVSVFLFCWGEQARQCKTLPQMWGLHVGHQPGESREEKQFLGWDGRGGKRQKGAALSWAGQQCRYLPFCFYCGFEMHNIAAFLRKTVEITPFLNSYGRAWAFSFSSPTRHRKQAHHWDLSPVLFYSASTYVTMVVWLLVAKSHFPTVLSFETVVSNMTGSVVFFR